MAPASTELTTPAKSTQNADDRHRDRRQPGVARRQRARGRRTTPPASASAACACSRSRIGPLKSTSSSIANEPNAANVATSGLPMTRRRSRTATASRSPRARPGAAPRGRSRVRSQRTNAATVTSLRARPPESRGPSRASRCVRRRASGRLYLDLYSRVSFWPSARGEAAALSGPQRTVGVVSCITGASRAGSNPAGRR